MEIIFKLRPVMFITTRVTMIEIGIAAATINVARNLRKNHHSTLIANNTPSKRLLRTRLIERSI